MKEIAKKMKTSVASVSRVLKNEAGKSFKCLKRPLLTAAMVKNVL